MTHDEVLIIVGDFPGQISDQGEYNIRQRQDRAMFALHKQQAFAPRHGGKIQSSQSQMETERRVKVEIVEKKCVDSIQKQPIRMKPIRRPKTKPRRNQAQLHASTTQAPSQLVGTCSVQARSMCNPPGQPGMTLNINCCGVSSQLTKREVNLVCDRVVAHNPRQDPTAQVRYQH